jgi:signal transduction histidine kinase
VESGEAHFPAAAACVEKRVHSARRFSPGANRTGNALTTTEMLHDENFGELLGHELNNPLTGILGNAELLLAEPQDQWRKHFAIRSEASGNHLPLSPWRTCETVPRLSHACESREDRAGSL